MKPEELARLRAHADEVRRRFHRTRTTMDLPISADAAHAFSYDVPAALDHIARLEEALRPFADIGFAIDVDGRGFGAALFRDDATAFEATWKSGDEDRRLTWGDFRRARAALGEGV